MFVDRRAGSCFFLTKFFALQLVFCSLAVEALVSQPGHADSIQLNDMFSAGLNIRMPERHLLQVCDPGFSGTSCDLCSENDYTTSCSSYCYSPVTCSGHGRCKGTSGACICYTGWDGADCSISLDATTSTTSTTSAAPTTSTEAQTTTTEAPTTTPATTTEAVTTSEAVTTTEVMTTPPPGPCGRGFEELEVQDWFDGGCTLSRTGAPPDPGFSDAAFVQDSPGSFTAGGFRQWNNVIVVKVDFPVTPFENAMLFEVGGGNLGAWAGMRDGRFFIQAGSGVNVNSYDAVYEQTSYLVTDNFPADGAAHTVIIEIFNKPQWHIRLSIDSKLVAEGTDMSGTQSKGYGGGASSWGVTAGNTVKTPVSRSPWPAALRSPLVFYLGTVESCQGDEGLRCGDVDECSSEQHNCAAQATCTNTEGSFACQCDAGLVGDGVVCDLDECADASLNDCHSEATCSNTVGSFECACNDGFSGSGSACADVDECDLGTHNCNTDATCSNQAGTFTCACLPGFDGDGIVCADVDECASGNGGCAQTCSNSDGGFDCSCAAGWTLNADSASCDDVDECISGNGGCDQICSNSDGGRACACEEGWTLNADGETCDEDGGGSTDGTTVGVATGCAVVGLGGIGAALYLRKKKQEDQEDDVEAQTLDIDPLAMQARAMRRQSGGNRSSLASLTNVDGQALAEELRLRDGTQITAGLEYADTRPATPPSSLEQQLKPAPPQLAPAAEDPAASHASPPSDAEPLPASGSAPTQQIVVGPDGRQYVFVPDEEEEEEEGLPTQPAVDHGAELSDTPELSDVQQLSMVAEESDRWRRESGSVFVSGLSGLQEADGAAALASPDQPEAPQPSASAAGIAAATFGVP